MSRKRTYSAASSIPTPVATTPINPSGRGTNRQLHRAGAHEVEGVRDVDGPAACAGAGHDERGAASLLGHDAPPGAAVQDAPGDLVATGCEPVVEAHRDVDGLAGRERP